jgi:hypothetical protein
MNFSDARYGIFTMFFQVIFFQIRSKNIFIVNLFFVFCFNKHLLRWKLFYLIEREKSVFLLDFPENEKITRF